MMGTPEDFWNEVITDTISSGSLEITKIGVNGEKIPSPEDSGIFHRSIGERKGQIADFRCPLDGTESGVHVVEFEDHYSVHIDRYDPDRYPVRHLVHDSPKTLFQIIGIGIFSALMFTLFRRR
ncbi:MAG: hypothetical protein M1616_06570 [Candidatus Thermoplasmatota archaeon]|jgi:hypothetical protein|nr:hypothetical protein [Candidatus Thermoplasmatota archaeon]